MKRRRPKRPAKSMGITCTPWTAEDIVSLVLAHEWDYEKGDWVLKPEYRKGDE